jgi:hypothetical protein
MKNLEETSEEQAAYHNVLAYLAENPNAQDTLEGIMEWWLLEQNIRVQTSKVKKVLTRLVDQGFVLERKGMDSRVMYCINGSKREVIREILDPLPPS